MTVIKGKLVSGRGAAKEHLRKNLKELATITGENIYLGSLNLILSRPYRLNSHRAFKFDNGKRMLWQGWIKNKKVWLYRWRSAPLHVLEIISDTKLRREFSLQNLDLLSIEINNNAIDSLSIGDKLLHVLLWSGRKKWYYNKEWYSNKLILNLRKNSCQGCKFKLRRR